MKQGGVLSPLLFTLFVDIVLDQLERSKLGCFVNYTCFNSLMYADDIVLLSASVTDLQKMFDICADIFKILDLPVNISKCHCMRIGPRHKYFCKPIIFFNNQIEWVDSVDYLGISICKSQIFKCSWYKSKCKFFRSANAILGRLGSTTASDVVLKLVNSNSLPVLLYGTTAVSLTVSEMKDLGSAYDSLFSKVFRIYDKKSILKCQYFFGCWPVRLIYEYNRFNYLNKLFKEEKLKPGVDIDQPDYTEYCNLITKYIFDINDSINTIRFKIWCYFEKLVAEL